MEQGSRTTPPMAPHLTNKPPDERGLAASLSVGVSLVVVLGVVVGVVVAVTGDVVMVREAVGGGGCWWGLGGGGCCRPWSCCCCCWWRLSRWCKAVRGEAVGNRRGRRGAWPPLFVFCSPRWARVTQREDGYETLPFRIHSDWYLLLFLGQDCSP